MLSFLITWLTLEYWFTDKTPCCVSASEKKANTVKPSYDISKRVKKI
jgi:hypothetical protein